MIVIPMAGMSRRFTEAGYDRPKYMLPLHGRSVFAHAVASFEAYFKTHPFLFIARDVADTDAFIRAECEAMAIDSARIVLLDQPTAGQAETVALGMEMAAVDPSMPVTIFNIDTFRPGFRFPSASWWADSDGYLEVFVGSGANWSYVRPNESDPSCVAEAAEKREISNLCCTGLYHFNRADQFRSALAQERAAPSAAELYVAPIYNHLIAAGLRVHYEVVPARSVVFCGVPDEYERLRAGSNEI